MSSTTTPFPNRASAMEAILAHFKALTPSSSETHIIPAAKMTQFLSYNYRQLQQRPDMKRDAVKWDTEALARMRDAVEICDPYLTSQAVLKPGFPSLLTLWETFERVRTFVPFDEMLEQLQHVVRTVAKRILRERDEQNGVGGELVLLALPDNVVDKSYLWLIMHCWSTVPELRLAVDFVIPAMGVTRDMFRILGDPKWKGRVLYIDDMAYSGKQMQMFIAGDGPAYDQERITVTPCLAYATHAALDLAQISYASNKIDMTVPMHIVRTPLSVLMERNAITPAVAGIFRSDISQSLGFQREGDVNAVLTSLVDEFGPHGDDVSTLPLDLKRVLLLYYRFTQLVLPVILFEHKLADSWSISHNYLYLQFGTPELEATYGGGGGDSGGSIGTGEPLVLVRGASVLTAIKYPANGSSAFYKGTQWVFEPTPGQRIVLPDATLIRSFFAAHAVRGRVACASCSSTRAQNWCAGCGSAFYCDVECQRAHADAHDLQCRRTREGVRALESNR